MGTNVAAVGREVAGGRGTGEEHCMLGSIERPSGVVTTDSHKTE